MIKNVQLKTLMMGAFTIMVVIAMVIAAVGLHSIDDANNNLIEISDVRLPSVEHLLFINGAKTGVLVAERGLTNNKMMDPQIRQAQYKYIENAL